MEGLLCKDKGSLETEETLTPLVSAPCSGGVPRGKER